MYFSVVIDRASVLPGIVTALRHGWRMINCADFVRDERVLCHCDYSDLQRPDKLGCRSNSLCFCAPHTSSYVFSKFFTFRCLVGDVCQGYGPFTFLQLSVRFLFFSLSFQFVPNSLFKKEKLSKCDLLNVSETLAPHQEFFFFAKIMIFLDF